MSKVADAFSRLLVHIETPSFLKFLAIQGHAENLEEQLWMQGREGVSVISQRSVTNSDYINKLKKASFWQSVSTFLQLAVAINDPCNQAMLVPIQGIHRHLSHC